MKKKKYKKYVVKPPESTDNEKNEKYGIKAIERYQDVAGSEDEFELERDKILLDAENGSDKEDDNWSISDKEVLRLDTTSLESEPASEHSDQIIEEDEDDINIQNWGKHKKNYYDAELSEDAIEEEEEALRLQKRHLSKLKENDFIDCLDEWKEENVDEQKKLDYQTEIIKEELPVDIPENLSNEEAANFLKKLYPEFILFSKEYQFLYPLLDSLRTFYEKATGLQKMLSEQKFFSLSAYLGVLAMYFSIISDPNREMVSMRDHPIMINLMRCKQLWEKIKNIEIDPIITNQNMQLEESDSIKNDIIVKTQKKKKKKEHIKDTKQEEKKNTGPNFDDLNISNVEESLRSIKNISNKLKKEEDDYREHDSSEIINFNEKNTKKRPLKFYTTQINQKIAKKVRFSNSGDTDIPYFERKNDRMMQSIKETKEGMENQDDDFSDSETNLQSDDSDENYYNMLSDVNKKRKLEKKMEHDMKREREKKALIDMEDEIVDGKRKIRYDIEKNKGIIPYRPKEVRNPRVKKRKKYEAAKKKLASKVPIYKGVPKDAYKGEATGIKTHLVKSVKFR